MTYGIVLSRSVGRPSSSAVRQGKWTDCHFSIRGSAVRVAGGDRSEHAVACSRMIGNLNPACPNFVPKRLLHQSRLPVAVGQFPPPVEGHQELPVVTAHIELIVAGPVGGANDRLNREIARAVAPTARPGSLPDP